MKTCTGCREQKPLTEFWRDKSKRHGHCARCKQCKTAAFNRYRSDMGYDRRRYWADPQGERERHLVRKYGITLADYDRMLKEQGGGCAVCQRPPVRSLDVDHDHATGRVRGLLCTNCNRMIGHAGDDPSRLMAASVYLKAAIEVIP